MSGLWILTTLLVPPVAAVIAGLTYRGEVPAPAMIGLNAVMPGSGLAAAGRPTLEILAGVLFAQMTMLSAGGVENLGFVVPSMMIGGFWGLIHTDLSPFKPKPEIGNDDPVASISTTASRPSISTRSRPSGRATSTATAIPASHPPPPKTSVQAGTADRSMKPDEDRGYVVTVNCTECGADAPVPVLEHMAACTYCGTRHLVVGHDQTLHVTIPEKVQSEVEVRDAVLDHYRYLHYLKLYKRHVAPIEAGATQTGPNGQMVTRPDVEAVAAAAEALITARANTYRAHLATQLEVTHTEHFLAPYRHGMGTLYQAAFGRSLRDQNKQLRFTLGTVEAVTLATDALELPAMGRLSYLRALEPAAKHAGTVKALPLDHGENALVAAYGNLDRKQLVRDISVIRLGTTFSEEIEAVVWRPWWTASVQAPGLSQTLLIDSAAGSVAGDAPDLDPDILVDLPEAAHQPGTGLRFLPMQCPTCGFEFGFMPSATIHFCSNCHRVFEVQHGSKVELEYCHGAGAEDQTMDLVPFWEFELRIRTDDGKLLTDLDHLRDGIDGTFDQLGDDAVAAQHSIYVPAIRCINGRLMAQAHNRLFDWLERNPPQIRGGRFGLESKPSPWVVAIDEEEARRFAPLLLVNAFTQRDIARVNVHQIDAWLFKAKLESRGRLAYLPVEKMVTEPFRRYTGRQHAAAVEQARGTAPSPNR